MFSVFVQYLFLLTSYPIARWILPQLKNKQNIILFNITFGLGICSLLYKTRIILAFSMLTVGYILLDKNPYLTFIISFLMHVSFHIIQIISPNHVQIKGFTRILFCKIVSTSFNLFDGRQDPKKKKNFSNRQKICSLTRKPSYFEWLAYCFTPFGSISPSFYEFRLFEWILNFEGNKEKVSEKSRLKSIECLKQSFLHFLIYFSFRHYFCLAFYQSEFYLNLNLIIRISIMLFLGVIMLNRFFMQWKAVDAGLYEVGFEDSGILSEDEFSSLTLLNLLKKSTIKDYGKAFNHTNNLFWSNYLKSRGADSGISQPLYDTLSTCIKPFFMGLNGGYFLGPFERKLYSRAEKVLHDYAPLLLSNCFWLDYGFTQMFMIASKASIRFKTVYAFFYINYVIDFIFWIVASALVLSGFLLERNAKTDIDNTNVKKDDIKND